MGAGTECHTGQQSRLLVKLRFDASRYAFWLHSVLVSSSKRASFPSRMVPFLTTLSFQVLLKRAHGPASMSPVSLSCRSHNTGNSHKPLALAGDFLVCTETEDEDPDSFNKNPVHPPAFAGASLIALGEFSSHDSARARFLPPLAIQGLMSRRF